MSAQACASLTCRWRSHLVCVFFPRCFIDLSDVVRVMSSPIMRSRLMEERREMFFDMLVFVSWNGMTVKEEQLYAICTLVVLR